MAGGVLRWCVCGMFVVLMNHSIRECFSCRVFSLVRRTSHRSSTSSCRPAALTYRCGVVGVGVGLWGCVGVGLWGCGCVGVGAYVESC